jgi:hypothetical protein
MLEACQVPKDVLASLSTQELAEICLNYPLFFEYTSFNDERTGISVMIENFNGLSELAKREDGTRELIKKYKDFPVLFQSPKQSVVIDENLHKLPYLELLMSNDIFISKLNSDECAELSKIVLKKYTDKVANMHVYSLYNVKKTFLLGAVVINKQGRTSKSQTIIKRFIDDYKNPDANLYSEISKIISEL